MPPFAPLAGLTPPPTPHPADAEHPLVIATRAIAPLIWRAITVFMIIAAVSIFGRVAIVLFQRGGL